jgi:GAF domain-containing protein/DNA-binding response OmpR family regulator
MSNKKLRPKAVDNRISSLFADLEEQAAEVSQKPMTGEARTGSTEPALVGWTWDCDARGNYVALSADIEAGLGRPAAEFIGQPLVAYGLIPESSNRLQNALKKSDLPVELDVDYLDNHGQIVPVRIYITSLPGMDDTGETGWHGFAQQLAREAKRPVQKPRTKAELARPVKKESSSSKPVATLPLGKIERSAAAREDQASMAAGQSSLTIPFQIQENELGLLELLDDTPGRVWSEDERKLVAQVADQLALALENARLFQETQAALAETRTLYAITSATTRSLELKDTLGALLVQVLTTIGVESGLISMVNQVTRDLELVVQHDLPEAMRLSLADTGLQGTLCDLVYRRKEAVNIADFSNVANIPAYVPDLSGLQSLGFRSYLGVPLVSKGRILGTLCTFGKNPRPEQEQSLSLLQVAGQQIGIAIDNAQLFQETQSRADELAVLNEMASALSSRLDVGDVIQNIYNYTSRLIDCTNYFIALFDPLTEEVSFPLVIEEDQLTTFESRRGGKGLTEYIIQTRQPLLIQNQVTAWIEEHPEIDPIGKEAHSWLGVPMMIGAQVIGVIAVQSYTQANVYTGRQLDLMTALASQGAIAIQNARLFQETELRAEELGVLNEMGRTLAASLDVHEVTEALYLYVSRLMNTYSFFVALYDEAKEEMELPVVYTSGTRIYPPKRKLGVALSDYVIRNKVSILLNGEDITEQQEQLGVHFVGLGDAKPAKSWLGVPLLFGNNILGAVVVQSVDKPYLYTEPHRRLLIAVASQAAIAIQNARLFEQTQAALGETEGMYQASAELNTAQSYREILEVLRRYSIAGLSAHHVNISYFEHPWTPGDAPEWVDVLARWTEISDQEFTNRYPLQAYPSLAQLIQADRPLIVEDLAGDPRLDETTRELYTRLFKAASTIFVPLVVGFQWVGFITANYPDRMSFPEEEVRRLMALAGQAAVAVQNLRSVAVAEQQAHEAQRRSEELALVNRVVSAMVSSADLRQVLDAVAGQLVQAFRLAHASIALLNPERNYLLTVAESTSVGDEPAIGVRVPVQGNPAVERVLQSRQPVMVTDAQTSPLLAPMQVRLHERGIQTIAFFPIIAGGDVIGTIGLDIVDKGRAFSTQELALAETLVGQISTSIQNANLFEQNILLLDETRRRVQDLSVLFELSQSLAGVALASHEIAHIIAQYFIRIMEYTEVSVSLLDIDTGELHYLEKLIIDEKTGEPVRSEDVETIEQVTDNPAAMKVMQTLKPLVLKLSDRNLDPQEKDYLEKHGLKSQVALPLAVKGLVLGMISLQAWDQERDISTDQLNLAMTLVNSAATALENARLYENQRQTAEQLREVDKLKSQFLANMSHELRTPLNSIIGFSRVILKGIDGPVSELQKQDLAAINSAGQHLLQLINDVLDISKIEAGKMELAFDDEVNLGDLITSAMSTAVGLTKDKPIELIKLVPTDLPVVRADPTRIRQVLINFLSNAGKFTEEGSITVFAEVVADDLGLPEIKVSVRDTGVGIAKEDQERLFLPFSQVDASPTRKVGGSGLGLSISRLLIELHGGRIGVQSEPGAGSTFYFTLPLTNFELSRQLGSHLVEGLPHEKIILTIDDDRAVLNLYERYLVDHGYRVVPLVDPSRAVEVALKIHPFAITLDIMMPRIDGWQVLEALKGDQGTRDIPVIICSIVENQEKGLSLGAVGYLTKPLLEEDLIKALDHVNGDGSLRDILMIDDEPDDLRLVQRILTQKSNYKVRLAHGGLEGLVALQTQPPQVVILDLFMPDLDGFTILETMRSDPTLAQLPVIIFTAGDLSEQQYARLAEFSKNLLYKSTFDESELLGSLDNLLSKMK